MFKIFHTKSPEETKNLGKKIASTLIKKIIRKRKTAAIFALIGELGAGKTTFLQGFAKGFKIKERVLSPTFVIIKRFKILRENPNFEYFYHIDCYRIEKEKEILNLGFKKIIKNSKNVVAIEWPEKIKKVLPKKSIWVYFEIEGKAKRKIKIKNFKKLF